MVHPKFEFNCDVTMDDGCAAVNLAGGILKRPQPSPSPLTPPPNTVSLLPFIYSTPSFLFVFTNFAEKR